MSNFKPRVTPKTSNHTSAGMATLAFFLFFSQFLFSLVRFLPLLERAAEATEAASRARVQAAAAGRCPAARSLDLSSVSICTRLIQMRSSWHLLLHRLLIGNPPMQGGPGSVRFGYGFGMERFKRFRFSVPAVPLQKGLLCVSV